ncbi:cyclic pyranopterin monophosphate synthase MoaC [Stieleria marina]|uniref:cyclic pyranopterin monophosphate synthase n=1 Tax=Stieleria marina TaxID=1930275 RepID=A0A517NT54_9BACT|nr:Cyclic pyranopterin monophosphate synthase accessory protein 1 [Planctomycetes bacterium K23_9]
MVDVSDKPPTFRQAIASSELVMLAATADLIRSGTASKGDVLSVARIAAIQATKLTQQLIPLCHSIPIESVAVEFEWIDRIRLRCRVTVGTTGRTGVEMEAMTAASVAALTVYDMVKSVDRGLEIHRVVLEEKSGGKSGEFVRKTLP